MEITLEKSTELASIINDIKLYIFLMDVEYAKAVCDKMMKDAERSDAAAALNFNYNPVRVDTVRKQAQALRHLINYVEALKEADELKKEASNIDSAKGKISKMFF